MRATSARAPQTRSTGGQNQDPQETSRKRNFHIGAETKVLAGSADTLVEIGFGTNPDEARYMSSASGQEEIANAIVAATLEYLERYERRVGGGAGE